MPNKTGPKVENRSSLNISSDTSKRVIAILENDTLSGPNQDVGVNRLLDKYEQLKREVARK